MKRRPGFLSLFALPLLMFWPADPASAQKAGSPPSDKETFEKGQTLARQGNHREAADLGKKLIASTSDPHIGAQTLTLTVEALGNLGASPEQEEVIEDAVKRFPKSPIVLTMAGLHYRNLPHYGTVIDGKFERAQQRNQGRDVQTSLRDRVRALQILEQGLKALTPETTIMDRQALLAQLAVALSGGRGYNSRAWAMLALTDLSKLPDYDDQSGLDNAAGGYPVDAGGNPIYFKLPAKWEEAENDGGRMLWILEERSRIGTDQKYQSRQELAQIAKTWFSVRSLAEYGLRFDREPEDATAKRDGIAALHTLTDDETTAKLATGPKRFTLPAEWSFLKMFQALGEAADAAEYIRVDAWAQIAAELTDRRQYPRAVEALRKAHEITTNSDMKKGFQDQMDQITRNLGSFEPQQPQPAGTEAELSLVFRNAQKISLTARKVDIARLLADTEAYLRGSPQDNEWYRSNVSGIGRRLLEKDGGKYLGEVAHKWEQELKPRANHWDRRVEVKTPLKEAGAWLIEGTFEGGQITRALLWLESLVIVRTKQAGSGHYFIADAVTGAPVAGATVKFFGYRQEWKEPGLFRQKPRRVFIFKDFQSISDAQGQVLAPMATTENFQWLISAGTEDKRLAFLGFESLYFHDNRDSFNTQTRLYAITDRPVYRPDQEVKWKIWARSVSYDPEANLNNFAGAKMKVVINDPRGETLMEKEYTADANGAINDTLLLKDDATLGSYQMSVLRIFPSNEQHVGGHQFRVEEYKKPEFEVKVEAPTTPVALGDKFEVKVKADFYFGGPVKEGKVKYKVERSAFTNRWFPAGRWDWLFGEGYGWRASYYSWYPGAENWCYCVPRWPWMHWQSDPPELVAEGEAPLNADGTFTIKVDTALAKEIHGDEDHKYSVTAEVTDQSRRTIYGSGTVLAARRPFEVYVSLDRGYYQAGEGGEVRVNARTLDGKSVKASGPLKLFRISYDADGKPTETEAASFDIQTGDEETKQKVKWDRGGQYRVSAKLKDAAGHEIEGVSFVTVRGAGFEEGKDFRFDDLELLTQKDEYAPGEEVEITLNTNRAGSTVALFLRAQNSVYPKPVWIKLEGKSTTHRFKLTEADQPNIYLEAYTVSDARVHRVTRQVIVPPKKRIATVELEPDSKTYLPRQGSTVKVRVKDQDGKPFTGQVVLTAYDKALEYISGGGNQEDIRPFFWGWKRSHYPQVQDSLHGLEVHLMKEGESWMQVLGVFGGAMADDDVSTLNGGVGFKNGRGRMNARTRGAPGMRSLAFADADSASMSAAGAMPTATAAPAPMAMKAMAAEAAPPPPPPEQAGGEEGPAPMIRSNLADSAVWIADLTTDANGEGTLNFDMPDNLTTWKLRSWVMGPQTQVGEADVEVITRKNLMVRLQAPRFFVEKDEVVISANVHNEMDVSQDVRAVLELEGGVLELLPENDAKAAPVSLAAHSEKRIDWRVKATGEGEATIRVKALAQKDSDAMEMKFPVYTHGMLKTDSWSLAIRPDQAGGSLKLKVPAERKPGQSRLEVRFSPTLAMALVDALPYLADYPYGCTEQTLNRFLPTVLTLKVIKDLGVNLEDLRAKRTNLNAQEIGDAQKRGKQRWQGKDREGKLKEAVFDDDEVKKMAKAGLDRLEAMRGSDGGWGWFPGGRESSAHITALVMHGLKAAENTGFDINDGLINNGAAWLTRHEAEELRRLRLPEKHRDFKRYPDNLDAFIHSVLVEYGKGDKGMRTLLYDNRQKLSRYNIALLGLACDMVKETERRDMCLRNLRQFLKQDDENQSAYLELPEGGWWWYWYEDQIETQAAFLRLLCAAEPKGETAPRIAKYLLNNRRNGTYWNSTKDTSAVIEALAAFVKASGESNPQQTVELLVDGKSLKKVEITKENLFSFNGTFVLEGDEVTTGEHTVELRKLGESPLYVNAYLTVFSQEDMIPAAGLEVKARRKFYKLIEEKPEQQVAGSRGQVVTQTGFKYRREEISSDAPLKSGDLVEVELTVESKNDYEYVIIEDMKPAGFEPVEVRSGWNYEGLHSYQEFRDEKVAFFAERLPRGTHNLSYRVKAEIPGRFSALPAKIEAMYAPELKGNSLEWKAKIVE